MEQVKPINIDLGGGWVPIARPNVDWSVNGNSGPMYEIVSTDDLTDKLFPGCRIYFEKSSVAKYGIVHEVGAWSGGGGGSMTFYAYLGTDYTSTTGFVNNAAYSPFRFPQGFLPNPDKWTIAITDTNNVSQSSPVAATKYNLGSISITLRKGIWLVSYNVFQRVSVAAGTNLDMYTTLSTANNTESDATMTRAHTLVAPTSGSWILKAPVGMVDKVISLSGDAIYYLNGWTTLTVTDIAHRGAEATTTIKALSAYF